MKRLRAMHVPRVKPWSFEVLAPRQARRGREHKDIPQVVNTPKCRFLLQIGKIEPGMLVAKGVICPLIPYFNKLHSVYYGIIRQNGSMYIYLIISLFNAARHLTASRSLRQTSHPIAASGIIA